jgi:hypothetical protein
MDVINVNITYPEGITQGFKSTSSSVNTDVCLTVTATIPTGGSIP